MKHIIPNLILLLATLGLVAIARAQHRRGVYAPLAAWWRGASRLMRGLVLALVFTAVAYGSDKILGGHIGEGMRIIGGAVTSLCTNVFTTAERQTGYAASAVSTNETHDLAMPAEGQMAERIARRGAHNDGFYFFDAYTNRLAHDGLDLGKPVWVHTDGTLTVRSPAPELPIQELALIAAYSNITVYAPLQSSYGFLPAGKWPEFMPSLIWTATTDRGSRVVTWEGARLDRDVAQPVSFQAEFHEDGEVTYRYDTFPTNGVATGVFRNGAALAFNSADPQSFRDFLGFQDLPEYATLQPADITSLTLSYVGDLSDGSGDTDDDGLTDWEEVKRYHTDPHDADTDGDGLVDGFEVQNDTDPLNPDSNGDGMPDGWSQEQYAAHRLFNGQEGDRTVTITLQASTPASNRAVLRIGDMPILLCETNTWTFSIPTGTVWNVELRTDGLPVQLALEAGEGIFAEDADDIFASCLLEEEQQVNLRSVPTNPQPSPGGSRGGSAKLYAPCIFLDPVSQVVHCDETAIVRARCIPVTPPLSGKLIWSFDPNDASAYVDVAQDTLSATVSGLGPESPSSIMLHADVGYALTTSATVHYCSGHDDCPTNHVSFPPNHTNVTINPVFRKCEHPFNDDEDDPKVFLEVEVGRETAIGWQHLAWVDTDSETPGLQQRTPISRDHPPTINWNAKATSSAPLANGTDSLIYDELTTFARALPAVTAGQYVPPPFATIVSRTFDDKDNLIAEFSTTLAIPQYVKITWDNAVLDEFRQPITFNYVGIEGDVVPSTNVTIFAGCSASNAAAAFETISSKVQSLFPANANIVVVGPNVNVPQPHKTIIIQTGQYVNPTTGATSKALGRTPNEHCHARNDSPSGTSHVYDGSIRQSLTHFFGDFHFAPANGFNPMNDWRNVPLPLSPSLLTDYMAQVGLHECCHAMGVVPAASDFLNGHNRCTCGGHFMDSGKYRWPPMYLGFISSRIQRWMPKNEMYLEFVFPLEP